MAATRTKAEVKKFLDSKVGHVCVDKSNSDLNGQCVCLIKNLMEFLGVPNPYAARGNAKDAGDNYIAQGIGTKGKGKILTIVVNRDMGVINGVRYGHIWVDMTNEANYESNGARALVVTKNTRPISQGQQFVNFDKWIKKEGATKMIDRYQLEFLCRIYYGRLPSAAEYKNYVGKFTFAQTTPKLRATQEYKNLQTKSANGTLNTTNHLPDSLRNIYKPMKPTN